MNSRQLAGPRLRDGHLNVKLKRECKLVVDSADADRIQPGDADQLRQAIPSPVDGGLTTAHIAIPSRGKRYQRRNAV